MEEGPPAPGGVGGGSACVSLREAGRAGEGAVALPGLGHRLWLRDQHLGARGWQQDSFP